MLAAGELPGNVALYEAGFLSLRVSAHLKTISTSTLSYCLLTQND